MMQQQQAVMANNMEQQQKMMAAQFEAQGQMMKATAERLGSQPASPTEHVVDGKPNDYWQKLDYGIKSLAADFRKKIDRRVSLYHKHSSTVGKYMDTGRLN